MDQRLDALQQTLLAIGAAVYQQANQEEHTYGSDSGAWANGHPEEQPAEDYESYTFDNDNTVTVDYESVD